MRTAQQRPSAELGLVCFSLGSRPHIFGWVVNYIGIDGYSAQHDASWN